MTTDPSLLEYQRLPYARTTERVDDEDGAYYVCRYPDLPGLSADGATQHEATWNAERAFDDYILARLHFGDPIPEPAGADRIRRALAAPRDVAVGGTSAHIALSIHLPAHVKRQLHRAIAEDNYVNTGSRGAGELVSV